MKIVGFEIDSDETVGTGGFLSIRRLRMRNRRADGTFSRPYVSDALARPYGQDAVAVVIYARTPRGLEVLLRDGMRPTISVVRDRSVAPLPEPPAGLFLTELVAGILETGDTGEAGLRARAAAEVLEEAGFVVDPAHVALLGGGLFPSPGGFAEKVFFTSVEVDPATQRELAGDGSPMEEGATTQWMLLDDAIAACTRGELMDMKTEVGLRRLREAI